IKLESRGQLALPFPGSGPQNCVENQRPVNEPSLADMTTKALQLLETAANTKGIFLQVEGASIHKQDHSQNPCGQIGETIAFDKAVAAGLLWARSPPNTPVLVYADD